MLLECEAELTEIRYDTTNLNGTTYTSDAKGNLTYDGSSTYQYDDENRLTYACVGEKEDRTMGHP